MNDLIQGYYRGERATALLAASIGVLLLIGSWVSFRIAPLVSVRRGMAYVLLVGGLFFALTVGGYSRVVQQRMLADQTRSHAPDRETKQAEIVRMENILKSSYGGALRMFTSLICAGLLGACFSKSFAVRQGVAVGLIVLGSVGHITEAISLHRNRDYLKRVQDHQPVEAKASAIPHH